MFDMYQHIKIIRKTLKNINLKKIKNKQGLIL